MDIDARFRYALTMQSLPIIDRNIQRQSVTDLNKLRRGQLKQALSGGAIYVLTLNRKEDVGVVMGLDVYQQLTRDLHPVQQAPPRRKRTRAEEPEALEVFAESVAEPEHLVEKYPDGVPGTRAPEPQFDGNLSNGPDEEDLPWR